MVEEGRKPDPFTVKMKLELPAPTDNGLSDETDGIGFAIGLIENSAEPELAAPGTGLLTLTAAIPGLATEAAVICTCNSVSETKLVANAVPFH
jgi:hypothetical protein